MATSPKRLPNPQATKHLKNKSLLPAFGYEDVLAYEHAVAFTVAKMMNADLLADTQQALTQALEDGIPFGEFKKHIKPYLMAKGWWGEQMLKDPKDGQEKLVQLGSDRRLKTIYETNLSTAYAQGRWQKIQKNKRLLPYLQYMPSVSKARRDEHKGYYGLIRPVDDPIWQVIYPPNGFGCKCWTKSLTKNEAQAILKTQKEQGRHFDLPAVKEHNKRRGVDVKTVQGTQASFASNHDRLTALIKVAKSKHGDGFADRLKKELNIFFRKIGYAQRNDLDLTEQQIDEIWKIIKKYDIDPKMVRFVHNGNTSHSGFFGTEILQIGKDVYPTNNPHIYTNANSLMSAKATIAHELKGHRDAYLAGKTQNDDLLEEVQASIRGSLYGIDLTDEDKKMLYQDAIDRLQKNGLKLEEVKDKLWLEPFKE